MDWLFMIDAVLEFLSSDGRLHSVKEVARVLNLPLEKCDNIANFLVQYNFVQREDRSLRIDQTTRAFVVATTKKPLLQATPAR
jgi:DNA-binding IclR family transcriptional regulator